MVAGTVSVAVIGDGSVGKSTILTAFLSDDGQHGSAISSEAQRKIYKQTIGCDFHSKQIQLGHSAATKNGGDRSLTLRLWDIGGQSIHSPNLSTYISSADAILLVYDVTNRESFANVEAWLAKIRHILSQDAPNRQQHEKKTVVAPLIYLVGNKIDLAYLRQVTDTEHTNFVIQNDLRTQRGGGGVYCSATTGENLVRVIHEIAALANDTPLTNAELSAYNRVLKVTLQHGEEEELNDWAMEIEKQDMEAQRRRDLREQQACCVLQ